MFRNPRHNRILICIMWSISIITAVFFHYARHDEGLKESIRTNITLVPQFQILSYSIYLGVFLCAWFFNYILVERKTPVKSSVTKQQIVRHAVHSIMTFTIAYIDLIMFTIIPLIFFNVGYDSGNEFAAFIIQLFDIFYIFVFPPLALWSIYLWRKKK